MRRIGRHPPRDTAIRFHHLSIWEAAAPHDSLRFMLPGVLIMVPIILAYTGYSYWVFRGKTGHEGYH